MKTDSTEKINAKSPEQENIELINFPIVGIGASAGGLAAFKDFFGGIAPEESTGMAFILIQHLAPEHLSILPELIQNFTHMKVHEATDNMAITADNVYVIPPNKDLTILNNKIKLLEILEIRGGHRPIDLFFSSLAQEKGTSAICVVLSGTGTDGSKGLVDVNEFGGLVIVQDPKTAEYNGMPCAAIDSALADYVLSPVEMLDKIKDYINEKNEKSSVKNTKSDIHEVNMKNILHLLRSNTGQDFSLYKRNTIVRRIERRMLLSQIENIFEYYTVLKNNTKELESLFRDILIGVTSFFRDPLTFEALELVLEKICLKKSSEETLRIWVAGCSTGEEAYSIAITVCEIFDKLSINLPVQIFATDIDSQSLNKARTGNYPSSIVTDISKKRLDNYFTLGEDDSYKIKKEIRDLVIFSEQNYIKDPPFSKMDLISCRNSLIYMTSDLQKKVIPLFHYALNPEGFLFLGTAESIGSYDYLFDESDRKSRLYQKKNSGKLDVSFRPSNLIDSKHNIIQPKTLVNTVEKNMNTEELAMQEVLKQFSLSFVIVNEQKQILYVNGRTGKYLEAPQGKFNFNIINMAHEGLEQELTIALHKVITTDIGTVSYNNLKVRSDKDYTNVNLKVTKLREGYYLVIFEEVFTILQDDIITSTHDNEFDFRISEYTKEIYAKDEYLRAIREDMETTNEELKASNEEMQSVNEELQSANEELGTSKEELQSLNEELTTVNNELQTKISDLIQVSNDMNNLMLATGVGTIFVDHHLNIQRFTANVAKVVNLIKTDVGRPLEHTVSNLKGYNSLVEDVQAVLDSLIPKEVEVQSKVGVWYLLRILPYRTVTNVIEGAVITFIDITEIKKAHKILQDNEELKHMAAIARDSIDAFVTQDINGEILCWNPAAEKLYGFSEIEALKMNISELIPSDLSSDALDRIKELATFHAIEPYFTKRLCKNGSVLDVCLTSTALINEKNEIYAISTIERIKVPNHD